MSIYRDSSRPPLSAARLSAAPTTGTWAVGDLVLNTAAAPGGYVGWVCTTAGTQGTYTEGLTATTDGTTTVVLSASSTAHLGPGMYLTINGTAVRVVSILDTSMVVSSTIAASGPGTPIAYTNATFKEFGAIVA